MSKVTDQALLKMLNEGSGKVSDPSLLSKLNSTSPIDSTVGVMKPKLTENLVPNYLAQAPTKSLGRGQRMPDLGTQHNPFPRNQYGSANEGDFVKNQDGSTSQKVMSLGEKALAVGENALINLKSGVEQTPSSLNILDKTQKLKQIQSLGGIRVDGQFIPISTDGAQSFKDSRNNSITELGSLTNKYDLQRQNVPLSIDRASFNQEFEDSEGLLGAVKTIGSNPLSGGAFLAESLGGSAPAIAMSALTRNPFVLMALGGASGAQQELATGIAGYLDTHGYQRDTWEDLPEEVIQTAVNEASTRALVVGGVEALGGKIASKAILPRAIATTPTKATILNPMAQGVAGGVIDASGEATAQLASGQPYNPKEIVAEAGGGLISQPIESLQSTVHAMKLQGKNFVEVASNEELHSIATDPTTPKDLALEASLGLMNRGMAIDANGQLVTSAQANAQPTPLGDVGQSPVATQAPEPPTTDIPTSLGEVAPTTPVAPSGDINIDDVIGGIFGEQPKPLGDVAPNVDDVFGKQLPVQEPVQQGDTTQPPLTGGVTVPVAQTPKSAQYTIGTNEWGISKDSTPDNNPEFESLKRSLKNGKNDSYKAKVDDLKLVHKDDVPQDLQDIFTMLEERSNTPIRLVINNDQKKQVSFGGVHMRNKGIWVVGNSKDDGFMPSVILFHELNHNMKVQDPDLYQRLADFVRNDTTYGIRAEYARERGYSNLTADKRLEELVSDSVGNAGADIDFLKRLAKKDPNLFKDLADKLIKYLDEFLARAKALGKSKSNTTGSDKYLKDVEGFRNELEAVLIEHHKRGIARTEASKVSPINNTKVADNEQEQTTSERESDKGGSDGAVSTKANEGTLQDTGDVGGSAELLGDESGQASNQDAKAPQSSDKEVDEVNFINNEPKKIESSKDWSFSPLAKMVKGAPLKTVSAEQWKNWITANATKMGVKSDELEWTGINDWLALQEGKVSKEDIVAYLDDNGVQVTETVKGGVTLPEGLKAREATEDEIDNGNLEWVVVDGEDNIFAEGATRHDAINSAINDGYNTKESTKFDDPNYRVAGGKNYREVVLTLPRKQSESDLWVIFSKDGEKIGFQADEELAKRTADKAGGTYKKDTEYGEKEDIKFQSSHWDEPNVLAHIRLGEHTDADGNKVLFVYEIQSDWGQKGRKDGFNSGAKEYNKSDMELVSSSEYSWRIKTNDGVWEKSVSRADYQPYGGGLDKALLDSAKTASMKAQTERAKSLPPSAPFVTDTKAWVALSIKRVTAMAVEEGFDKVVFASGQQAADYFDLSKKVGLIAVDKGYAEKGHSYTIVAYEDSDGFKEVMIKTVKTENELAEYIGKDAAEKVIKQLERGTHAEIKGNDLKIGGEGMKAFYDKLVPQVANDMLKKLGGGKVEPISMDDGKQLGFTITDEMKAKVEDGDVPLFMNNQTSPNNESKDAVKGSITTLEGFRSYIADSLTSRAQALERKVPQLNKLFNRAIRYAGEDKHSPQIFSEYIEKQITVFHNRVESIIQDAFGHDKQLSESENDQLRNAILGLPVADQAIADAGKKLNKEMEDIRAEAERLGVSIGEVTDIGYFPRVYKTKEIHENPQGFKDDAYAHFHDFEFEHEFGDRTVTYSSKENIARYMGLLRNFRNEPTISNALKAVRAQTRLIRTSKDPAVRQQAFAEAIRLLESVRTEAQNLYAEQRSQAWVNGARMVHDKKSFETKDGRPKPTKERKLMGVADITMKDWLEQDARYLLEKLSIAMARKMALYEMYGKDPLAKIDSTLNNLVLDNKITLEQRKEADQILNDILSLNRNGIENDSVRKFADMGHALGYTSMLERAIFPSLFEAASYAYRSGDMRDIISPLRQLARAMFKSSSKTRDKELALLMGLVARNAASNVNLHRIGITEGDYSKLPSKILHGFFRLSFLQTLTDDQRVLGVRIGTEAFKRWAKQYQNGSATAKSFLNEHGINDADAFATWIRSLPDIPTSNDIFDVDGRMTPMGAEFSTAIHRFISGAIQNPDVTLKPAYASHPVGKYFAGIMSFAYSAYENIIKREAKILARVPNSEKAQRLAMITLPTMTTLFVAQTLISALRMVLDGKDPDDDELWEEAMTKGAANVIGVGMFNQISNYILGIKYENSAAETLVGAVPSYFLKAVDNINKPLSSRNSEGNETAENKMGQGIYDLAVAPTVTGALSLAPPQYKWMARIGLAVESSKQARARFAEIFGVPPEKENSTDKKFKNYTSGGDKAKELVSKKLNTSNKDQWDAEFEKVKAEYPELLDGLSLKRYADNPENDKLGRTGEPRATPSGKPMLEGEALTANKDELKEISTINSRLDDLRKNKNATYNDLVDLSTYSKTAKAELEKLDDDGKADEISRSFKIDVIQEAIDYRTDIKKNIMKQKE